VLKEFIKINLLLSPSTKPWRHIGVKVTLHAFLTLALDREEWSASLSGHFNSVRRTPSVHWTGDWVVSSSEAKNSCPIGATNFSPHHRVQTGSGAHPASYRMGTRGSFVGVKCPEREADHSLPSSAEVKECMELYLHSPIRLHGMVRS
jgi:hypothetical protein